MTRRCWVTVPRIALLDLWPLQRVRYHSPSCHDPAILTVLPFARAAGKNTLLHDAIIMSCGDDCGAEEIGAMAQWKRNPLCVAGWPTPKNSNWVYVGKTFWTIASERDVSELCPFPNDSSNCCHSGLMISIALAIGSVRRWPTSLVVGFCS
jgi:hypothetical protein